MGVRRKWIDFNGQLYDVWHLVSVEYEEEYNSNCSDFDYLIILNKSAVSRDFREVRINYKQDKAKRDADLAKWKTSLRSDAGFRFIGEEDPHPDADDGKVDDDYQIPQ